MKKFSDLGVNIENDRRIFECKQVSINEIVNCDIIIHEYIPNVKTRHGDNRYLVRISINDSVFKFFTNSQQIKDTLDAINSVDYPFSTIIKCVRIGKNSMYKFT